MQSDNANDLDTSEVSDNNHNMAEVYSEEDAIKDIAFLKTCKVDDANMAIIKKKLKLTVTERLNMVKEDKTNLLEQFPYFFVEPKLVCILHFYLHNWTYFE